MIWFRITWKPLTLDDLEGQTGQYCNRNCIGCSTTSNSWAFLFKYRPRKHLHHKYTLKNAHDALYVIRKYRLQWGSTPWTSLNWCGGKGSLWMIDKMLSCRDFNRENAKPAVKFMVSRLRGLGAVVYRRCHWLDGLSADDYSVMNRPRTTHDAWRTTYCHCHCHCHVCVCLHNTVDRLWVKSVCDITAAVMTGKLLRLSHRWSGHY